MDRKHTPGIFIAKGQVPVVKQTVETIQKGDTKKTVITEKTRRFPVTVHYGPTDGLPQHQAEQLEKQRKEAAAEAEKLRLDELERQRLAMEAANRAAVNSGLLRISHPNNLKKLGK